MRGRVRNMQTPEQREQATRDAAWLADNANSLHYRALATSAGMQLSSRQLDRSFPLTATPPQIADAQPKKRRWFR